MSKMYQNDCLNYTLLSFSLEIYLHVLDVGRFCNKLETGQLMINEKNANLIIPGWQIVS